LNKDLKLATEYKTYLRVASKEARRRMRRRIHKRLLGPTDADYLAVEEFGDMVNQFMFKLQRNVEDPIIHFKNVVGKISYVARLLLRLGYLVAAGFGIALLSDVVARDWFGTAIDWQPILSRVTSFGWLQLIAIIVMLIVIRRVVIRLSTPDSRPDAD
jgi:hypothetical protein